jgi:hypothetical protein
MTKHHAYHLASVVLISDPRALSAQHHTLAGVT